jgi:hypothetical protein
MQIVDDGAAMQIEEILACATIARPTAPALDQHVPMYAQQPPFTQVCMPLWRPLPLSQLDEQSFVGMNKKTNDLAFRIRFMTCSSD